jgi:hypothetical protein
MLIATGDRMLRHLERVLADPGLVANSTRTGAAWLVPLAPALRMAAATQLGDDAARQRVWPELLASDPAAEHAGLNIDALCYAVTGIRIATGAGVDTWLRCRPWLPHDLQRLRVRGIAAGGAMLDLTIDAGHDRLELELTTEANVSRLRVVVGAGQEQLVTELLPGQPFRCSLLRAQAEANDDARNVGRLRAPCRHVRGPRR